MKSKKKPQERPSIGAFHDPVGFLKAYCDYRKKTEGQFSLRSFSTEMGIATGYLPMLFSVQSH